MTYIKHVIPFLGSWLAHNAAQKQLNFCVSILSKDTLVFSHAFGHADIEKSIPLTTGHMFQVASQTKMLTASAILLLAEQGRLRIDDRAVMHLPWLKQHSDSRFQNITLRHLLTHTAGLLRDAPDSDYLLFKAPWPSSSDIKNIILQSELAATPGQHVKYSNTAFALLGQVIEAVSGYSYTTYIKKAIIRPLNLRGIIPDFSKAFLDERPVRGYGLPDLHQRPAIRNRQPIRSMAPAMGAYATTDAMCQLAASFFDGSRSLLSDNSKLYMQQVQSAITKGHDQGVAFGFGTELQTVSGQHLAGHGGHMAGHLTATFYDPNAKLAVSVAGNSKDTPSVSMVRGIFGAINYFRSASKGVSIADTQPFNGRFRNEISTVEIVQLGDKIIAIDPDDWEPFAWGEQLEIVHDKALRATDPYSLYNSSELIEYSSGQATPRSIRFAGLTMQADER